MMLRQLIAVGVMCAAAGVCGRGESSDPICFAFLQRGDLFVHCGGATRRVTQLGTVRQYAIDSGMRRVALEFDEVVTPRDEFYVDVTSTIRTVELPTGAVRLWPTRGRLQSTCGALFIEVYGEEQMRDLWNESIDLGDPKPRGLRCSEDRSVWLVEEETPQRRLMWAREGERRFVPVDREADYDLSSRGDLLGYYQNYQVCLQAWDGKARCVSIAGTLSARPAIHERGEVLVTLGTAEGCFFRNSTNFWPEPVYPEVKVATDACAGIAWWDGVAPTVRFLERVGTDPRWIEPAMAEELMKKADLLGRR